MFLTYGVGALHASKKITLERAILTTLKYLRRANSSLHLVLTLRPKKRTDGQRLALKVPPSVSCLLLTPTKLVSCSPTSTQSHPQAGPVRTRHPSRRSPHPKRTTCFPLNTCANPLVLTPSRLDNTYRIWTLNPTTNGS